MDSVFLLVACVFFALVVFAILLKGKGKRGLPPPDYLKREALLSAGELKFYQSLREAVADEFYIAMKVRLLDIVATRKGLNNSQRATAQNRVQSKHLDFVLCNPIDLAFVCAIELDDKSHNSRDRRERDLFVDKALRSAGVPVLHVKAARSYEATKLRVALESAIKA